MDTVFKRTPSESFGPELWTWRDLLQFTLDWSGSRVNAQDERKLRTATLDAYRDLCNHTNWNFLISEYHLSFDAAVEVTGSFDYTGGALERLVTVTSGTLPTWTEYAYAILDGVAYEVDQKISAGAFTLTLRTNPGQDKASGTITLIRTAYPAPADFKKEYDPQSERSAATLDYVTPDEMNAMMRSRLQAGEANCWSVTNHPKLYASRCVRVFPYPTSKKTVSLLYQRTGRALRISGFAPEHIGTFTLSTSIDANRATVTGITVTSKLNGAIFRLRSDTNTPENVDGQYPFDEQAAIIDVNTVSNFVYLDRDLTSNYTDKACVISDPIDLPQYALNVLKAGCRYYGAINLKRQAKEIAAEFSLYREALTGAREADSNYIPGSTYASVGAHFQDDDPA